MVAFGKLFTMDADFVNIGGTLVERKKRDRL